MKIIGIILAVITVLIGAYFTYDEYRKGKTAKAVLVIMLIAYLLLAAVIVFVFWYFF
jgi:hypothetical protein